MCHVSSVTCHLSPMAIATATDPPPANSPTMHSRLVHQDRTKNNETKSKPKKWLKPFKISPHTGDTESLDLFGCHVLTSPL